MAKKHSKALSLYPLKFNEAVTDFLKVPPPPKAQKPKARKKAKKKH